MNESDTIQIQVTQPAFYLNDSLAGFKYDSIPTYPIYDTSIVLDSTQLYRPHFVPFNKWIGRKDFINDWSVIVLTVTLIVFATIRNSSGKYLSFLFQSIFNYQTAHRLYRERVNNILHPSFGLEVLFFIVFGTFIFHVEKIFITDFMFSESLIYLLTIGLIIFYILGKNGLYRLSGFLFDNRAEVNEFIFHTKLGNKLIGIFLLPIALALFFTGKYFTESMLVIGSVILVFFTSISVLRAIKIISKKDIPIYYLILYLCTLEILPLLIAWRILWIL